MKNKDVIEKMLIERKDGKKWNECYYLDETMEYGVNGATAKEHIYQRLMHDLIAKKIHNCTYIRSIKRRQPYDGTEEITVTYDNGTRAFYKVEF